MGLFDKLIRKNLTESKGSKEVWNSLALIHKQHLIVDIDSDAHLFHSTDLGFALYNKSMKQGTVLTVGDRIPLACMFTAHWLTYNGEKCGYLFNSQFQVLNQGGYILTYLNNGVGKSSAVETLVKTDTLVVFSYPNHGALVVSPHLGQDMQTILDSQ